MFSKYFSLFSKISYIIFVIMLNKTVLYEVDILQNVRKYLCFPILSSKNKTVKIRNCDFSED